jgi:hypothetical protein
MKLKLLTTIAILLAYSVKAQDKICGDIEKYKQTYEWRDLPGCISDYKEEGDESQSTKGLLAYAKMQFKNFYDRWEANKILDTEDPIQTYVTACVAFMDPSSKNKWNSDPALKAALPLYEEQAKKVEAAYDLFFTKWKETVEFINQDYVYAEMYMTEIDKAFEEAKGKTMYGQIGLGERAVLRGKVQSIKPLLDKAAELKIPDGLIILGSGDIQETTLAQIRNSYFKKWSAYSAESDKKALEAYEAELAPYLKLMSGEKAKEFRNWYGVYMFGPGGRELKTPQDVANASAWYSSGTAVCTICPRWKVNGVRFNGMSIAGRTRQEGYGGSAPSSAFK